MLKAFPSKDNSLDNYCTSLPRIKPRNQSLDDSELTSYIKQQRLTDSLELLESFGYSNDSAILKIRYFQWESL